MTTIPFYHEGESAPFEQVEFDDEIMAGLRILARRWHQSVETVILRAIARNVLKRERIAREGQAK